MGLQGEVSKGLVNIEFVFVRRARTRRSDRFQYGFSTAKKSEGFTKMQIGMEHMPLEQKSVVVRRRVAPVLILEPLIVRPSLASQGKVPIRSG